MFTRSAVTIAAAACSGNSAGAVCTVTMVSSNTLHTITEVGALRFNTACDKGKFDVVYEYQILPVDDTDVIGS
jgi:hypothetical protein